MSSRGKPRLERRNAAKNFDYNPTPTSSSTDYSSSPSSSLRTRSLESHDPTSFRIEGNDGEFDRICRSLGLTVDDFAIPPKVWQSSKIRSSLDHTPQSRLNQLNSPNKQEDDVLLVESRQNELTELAKAIETIGVTEFSSGDTYRDQDLGRDRIGIREVKEPAPDILVEPYQNNFTAREICGIKGVRPSALKPPPSMTLPELDKESSTWEICNNLAPKNQQASVIISYSDEEDDRDVQVHDGLSDMPEEAKEQDLFPVPIDDDTSSSTTEPTNISPNGRINRTIRNWQKGLLLGSGSFGSVYEGIAE